MSLSRIPTARPPRWWTELPLIAVVYLLYSLGRLWARGDVGTAVDHGLMFLRAEETLHLDLERPLNRLLTEHGWLGVPSDFVYAALHYVVTPAVLVWVFRRRAEHYRAVRTWLMTSTLVSLLCYSLLPTCPPRLLSGEFGFVDTMAQYADHGWWGAEASAPEGMGEMTNQYAAMPSLHVGWAVWCAVVLCWLGSRTWWARTLAVTYPLLITFVVLGTANHYFLDALAGAAVMGLGLWSLRPVLALTDRAREAVRTRREPRGAATPLAASLPGPRGPESAIVSERCQTAAHHAISREGTADDQSPPGRVGQSDLDPLDPTGSRSPAATAGSAAR
ncbi:phosphatase PAP2 family protein [Streptomyces sp. NPDC005438]|uniref:phosphatase PAP2 family protein n=1 Tax=Streptomyces sp. NPDC005438 TaxID=3156880 RepID=UPI0033AE940F